MGMTDYQKYINALRKCAKEHENDRTFTGHIIVSDLCRDTANLLEELEQELKTGHWIDTNNLDAKYKAIYMCSNCRSCYTEMKPINMNFCPNCGSDNREVEK